jgi:hypothetical protein
MAVLAENLAAAADENTKRDDAVQQVSYSTGKAGGRLKWILRGPQAAKRDAESAVNGAEYDARDNGPSGRPCGVEDEQPSSKSWSQPLGDRTPTPATKRVEKSLEPTPGKKQTESKELLKNELIPQQHSLSEKCPSPKDLKRIEDLGTDIDPPAPPPNWTEDNRGVPRDCPLGDENFSGRKFAPITYTWTASALCHKPLYFEDVQLERYGHMAGPWLQPFASAANFFCTFPILPYKMGLELPNECIYTLGYYRPGSCAPYLFDPLPISVRATFFEAGAWAATPFMFP